ncbi:DUF4178 domain-containing protein [Ottowia sp.]|uniref:DUF4178 domain-containing protein n=1 Tax=Ottowia sp. TaxID=1898956 RepID=UPI003A894B2C
MTDTTGTQRHYTAPCPSCGAPVTFRSAQSVYAICDYCHSTVARQGEVLERRGKMAELAVDHSLLQLGASGRVDGQGFQLVGRLQYQYAEGTWAEWHALLADGRSAWLSEDNGAYVFSHPINVPTALPEASQFRVGTSVALNGQRYTVSARTPVTLIAAQGELPHLPALGQPFDVVELRTQDGEATAQRVLSIDYGSQPPTLSEGRAVALADLHMSRLKDQSTQESTGRQFACPNCGSPVEVKLAQTKSITCPQCQTLIDVSGGIGGELHHALQHEPVRPLIPLGAVGQMEGSHWQVVGFQHRLGQSPGDDESFGWCEYLLYNAQKGFCFLVDSEEGWSLVRPLTGAPQLRHQGEQATYDGHTYRRTWQYRAETSYALGEFYWQVQRGQITQNSDYQQGNKLLSSEQSAGEITWSGGRKISADAVVSAFKLQGALASALRSHDARPYSSQSAMTASTIIVVLMVLFIVLIALSTCSNDRTYSGRSSSGSWGGYSSGGGHK